ncbi:MAG: class I SAM-dependent methyltransferase [Pseudodesulfovibrio sp.]|nr:class I SAM-dependent methyltransferase [Pseudodesulfovibrio sp.]
MAHIAQDSLATIYFEIIWESSHVRHVDAYLAADVSFTRDILPLGLKSRMRGLGPGDSVEMVFDPSDVTVHELGKIIELPHSRFKAPLVHDRRIKPRIGRFYPQRLIEDVPGTRPDSTAPFRVISTDKAGFKADLNHPLAGRSIQIKASVLDVHPPDTDSGTLHRWPSTLMRGPGMQARMAETATDFLGVDPFVRDDETDDSEFYAKSLPSSFLDKQALENVQKVYGGLLSDGMDVLDLMAGSLSHLPDGFKPGSVTGLGLNREVMEANEQLGRVVIHNLNEEPQLPFEENSFDAVVCTASVEYLTKPFEVFEDMSRVLKPGGIFILTFADQWFASKAIHIWSELHEFERMGLVCQYFFRSEKFIDLNTFSERGWQRLPDTEDVQDLDKSSDSIFAVWARTQAE